MGSISLHNVTIFAHTTLFRNLSAVIGDGDRVGLVAGNGAGKSTLLKCLAGLAEPTQGEIVRSRGLHAALVEQDIPEKLLDLPLDEAVRRALPPDERDDQAWRVDMVLDEFETPASLRDRPVRTLSGGWQRLALIARAWISEPDALLLDEPTNDLDLTKVFWLETWINSMARSIPIVIASHDRNFLDACTTRTLFLRSSTCVAFAYPYRQARELLVQHDAAEETQRETTLREARRLRRSAQELRNIGINSRSDAAQKKSAQMARRAEVIEQSLHAKHQERIGEIRLTNRGTHARILASLKDVTVRRPDGGRLFEIAGLDVAQHDRIAVLGRNGVGKSQLIRLLRQAIHRPADCPGIRISPSMALGYTNQDMSQLPVKETPLAFILSAFRLGDQRSRAVLAAAGFTIEMQRQPISRLSSGQRARLGLLALRLSESNFYLMDEPTNHVDIAGREQLEAEILAAEATGIFVSHDRSFVETVGTRFLVIDGIRAKEVDSPDVFYRSLRDGGTP